MFCTFLQYLGYITLGIILPQSIVRMLFKRSETIVYGSTHTTTASLNGSIWISIETVSSRRAARWRHSRITIQFSVVWSRTFGPGSIPSPFETYEKHHHNQNQYDLENWEKSVSLVKLGKKYSLRKTVLPSCRGPWCQ